MPESGLGSQFQVVATSRSEQYPDQGCVRDGSHEQGVSARVLAEVVPGEISGFHRRGNRAARPTTGSRADVPAFGGAAPLT